jgi:flagellar P-ring protein precursor FlgI
MKKFKIIFLIAAMLMNCSGVLAIAENGGAQGPTVRIKDITNVKGVRDNQLVGYGLVVGLQGSGDNSRHTQMTTQQMLTNLGTVIDQANNIQKGAAAAVIVTATVPPFARNGDRLDITVSAMADAKSLEGGVLIQTQLKAPNGEVVAMAQGPVSVGGGAARGGGGGNRGTILTTGRVPAGAIVERDIFTQIGDDTTLTLLLDKADFTMAARVATTLTNLIAPSRALDGGAIEVTIPIRFQHNRIEFLSIIENIELQSARERARIVVNERTGTIIIGTDVRLAPAAIAHRGITVNIQENGAPQGAGGQNAPEQRQGSLVALRANSTLGDLVRALNTIGVGPTDLIAILQALRVAGSLQAELQVI